MSSSARPVFPFSAVVGADEAKLALILATIDPHIGGVLLRGEKGSAKSTLARALAALLPGEAAFTELPLGATEERVVGSLDLAAALGTSEVAFRSGLLAAAHGGVLYVDEVNLLADHLVDVLLDVAVTGINRVERDGMSEEHPARFVLIGTMNPEEGDLRPQLLDRFGLAVDVRGAAEPVLRAEAVRRRLSFDASPAEFVSQWAEPERELAQRLLDARPAPLDDELLAVVSEVCAGAGAEGLRADLTLARASAANAGWEGRTQVGEDDIRAVAHLVLAHRARRHPLDPPGASSETLDRALDDALGPQPPATPPPPPPSDADDQQPTDGDAPDRPPSEADRGSDQPPAAPDAPARVITLQAGRANQDQASGRRSPVTGDRGRTVGSRVPDGGTSAIAMVPTIAAAANRRATATDPEPGIVRDDLRAPVREARTGNLLVLAVDASGSMGVADRMAAVKGALVGLLIDAYQRRDRVALVTFGGAGANVMLRPTGSVEIARARLDDLPTGGDTPLADGIRVAADLATQASTPTLRPLLVLVTDGRATAGSDPWSEAVAAAGSVARRGLSSVVIDVEPPGAGFMGLASELAEAMGARHLLLPELTASRLESTLRSL